jgi:hypothetical protein
MLPLWPTRPAASSSTRSKEDDATRKPSRGRRSEGCAGMDRADSQFPRSMAILPCIHRRRPPKSIRLRLLQEEPSIPTIWLVSAPANLSRSELALALAPWLRLGSHGSMMDVKMRNLRIVALRARSMDTRRWFARSTNIKKDPPGWPYLDQSLSDGTNDRKTICRYRLHHPSPRRI